MISKLAVNLPARHPLTAQFLAVTSELAQPIENPYDPLLPVYQRGGVHLPGGVTLGSASTNPFGTVSQMIDPLASGGGAHEFLTGIASGSESPLVQIAANEATGINQFTGRPFTAPPGYGGSVQSFGRQATRRDPTTGRVIDASRPTPGLLQGALASLPLEPMARGFLSLAAGGNRPYDTTSDVDLAKYLLGHGSNPVDLFQPPSTRPRGVVSPMLWSQLASYFGAPIQQLDPRALAAQRTSGALDYQKAALATARARARAAAKLGSKP